MPPKAPIITDNCCLYHRLQCLPLSFTPYLFLFIKKPFSYLSLQNRSYNCQRINTNSALRWRKRRSRTWKSLGRFVIRWLGNQVHISRAVYPSHDRPFNVSINMLLIDRAVKSRHVEGRGNAHLNNVINVSRCRRCVVWKDMLPNYNVTSATFFCCLQTGLDRIIFPSILNSHLIL